MKALYIGSFDMFTVGHYGVLKQAEEIFDDILICIADNSTKDETSVICVDDDDDDDDDSDVEFNHLAPGEDVIGGMPSVSKKSPKFGEN